MKPILNDAAPAAVPTKEAGSSAGFFAAGVSHVTSTDDLLLDAGDHDRYRVVTVSRIPPAGNPASADGTEKERTRHFHLRELRRSG